MSPYRAGEQTPTVDVHAHILLPALQQLVAEADPAGFGAQQALEVRRNGTESMAASGLMTPLMTIVGVFLLFATLHFARGVGKLHAQFAKHLLVKSA